MKNTSDITEKKQKGKKLFQKGQSGNPKGRPKGSFSITEAIKRKLQEVYVDKDHPEERKLYLEKIIDAIFYNALVNKDNQTLKNIWGYIDGLPKATMAIDVNKESLEELTGFFRNMASVKPLANEESRS